jgi:hypothetical protein
VIGRLVRPAEHVRAEPLRRLHRTDRRAVERAARRTADLAQRVDDLDGRYDDLGAVAEGGDDPVGHGRRGQGTGRVVDEDEGDVLGQRRQRTAYGLLPGRPARDDGDRDGDVAERRLDGHVLVGRRGHDHVVDCVLERADRMTQQRLCPEQAQCLGRSSRRLTDGQSRARSGGRDDGGHDQVRRRRRVRT